MTATNTRRADGERRRGPAAVLRLAAAALTTAAVAGCAHLGERPPVPTAGPASEPETAAQAAGQVVGQAYAGLSLRDDAASGRTVVGWVYPGPLRGDGFHSPHLKRGDVLVAVNGHPLRAEEFKTLVRQSAPGDKLLLTVGRTDGPADTAVPTAGQTLREETVELILANRTEWTGPLDEPTPARNGPGFADLAKLAEKPGPLEDYLLAANRAKGQEEPVGKLLALFEETRRDKGGFHALSRVEFAFQHPCRLSEVCRLTTDPLARLASEPEAFCLLAAANLDASTAPALPAKADLSQPAPALAAMAVHMTAARQSLEKALGGIAPGERRTVAESLSRYMDSLETYDAENPDFIRSLRASMRVDFDALLAGAAKLTALAGRGAMAPADAPLLPRPPGEVWKAVEGDVLAVLETPGGWLVYGGSGANRYDMSQLAGVIDAGGDDRYTWTSEAQPEVQVIVDFAGDDRYEGAEAGGPGAACMGLSLLNDRAGNDRYEGKLRACGSALLGAALLLDADGADEYRAEKWSLGAGFYGAGALLDLGGGNDVYWAADSSEGIGGPRGFGLLFDAGGQDLYRANGPTPSAYGTPGVYYGLSQGVGFGVRGYDTGGIGILADRGGNDRYEAGEFSQGGAYFWGLGILDDRGGNDVYYGNRYAQGFGCHQAAGALIDHHGDDTYWAMCAADQGSAWDIAVGLLLDRQGNDSYQAEGLAQGSAAMQGIAWLIDLAGNDRYVAGANSSHGQSIGNSYHYDRTGCLSWSVLLDAGGGTDFYSSGRPNGQTLTPGSPNEKKPEDSGLHGLFSDTDEALDSVPR